MVKHDDNRAEETSGVADEATTTVADSMQRKFFSGLLWVLLLNILVKPFWILGVDVGVQNAVGAEEYGFYFTIFNLTLIFNILLDVGITSFNTRNIARHPQLVSKHLSSILSIKLMLLALYLVVTFTVGALMGYGSRQFILLIVLTFNQFLNSLLLYLRSNFEGLLLFRWDGVFSVIDRLMMIVICGGMLVVARHGAFQMTIEAFALAQMVAYLTAVFMALVVLLRRVPLRRLHFSRPFTLMIMRQSAPFAVLVLLMACYNRLDPILLSLLLIDGNMAAGVYASAFRLLDAITMVAYLVSVPLLPVYAHLTRLVERRVQRSSADVRCEQTAQQEMRQITQMAFSLLMVFAVVAAVVLSAYAEPIMALLYSDHVAESAQVFRILIYCIIPLSMTYIFGTLLTAAGRLRMLNSLALATLMLNITFNLFLIPRYGTVGSAWASLVAQSFMAVAQMVAAMRSYDLIPKLGYVVSFVSFVAAVVVCVAVVGWLPAVWIVQASLATVVPLLVAIVLRLIDVRAMMQLVVRRKSEVEMK